MSYTSAVYRIRQDYKTLNQIKAETLPFDQIFFNLRTI